MRYLITLEGKPKSTSHIYHVTCVSGYARTYMTAKGKAIKEDYQWQAASQFKRKPLSGSVRVTAAIYFDTKRKSDIDNFNKLFLDALNGIVWEDDSQIVELRLMKRYDNTRPRIDVEIELLG